MSTQRDYLLSPLAPLVFRTGMPFGATDAAVTVDFPLPSTLAGAVRAATSSGSTDKAIYDQQVHGPLLLERKADGSASDLLLPTPADLVFAVGNGGELKAYPLIPRPPKQNRSKREWYPNGLWPVDCLTETGYQPVSKLVDGPQFLHYADYLSWLGGSETERKHVGKQIHASGTSIPLATREHISIDPAAQSAREGVLFRTRGLDFGPRFDTNLSGGYDYGLVVRTELRPAEGLVRVGGRARLAHLGAAPGIWPTCPRFLSERLRRSRGLRLTVITPAIFAGGWLPSWLNQEPDHRWRVWLGQCTLLTLRAVALADWQPISMRDRHGARSPLRRMVPAGSVYWFQVDGGSIDAESLWLLPLSDTAKDRNDGFGLVVPGVWEPPLTIAPSPACKGASDA